MPFARFAWGVLAFNLGVILWGAVVRATGSGAGCGRHWPLCDGRVVPQDPATATLIEFAHRATSGIALVLVLALALWSRRAFPAGHPAQRGAVWSLGFIVIEALIGAGLVLLELVGDDASALRAAYLALHLANTFLLLGALTLTAHWAAHPEPARRAAGERTGALVASGLAVTLLVGMTGAVTALGDTLFPAASLAEGLREDLSPTAHFLVRLRVIHPALAVAGGLWLLWISWRVPRMRAGPAVEGAARLAAGMVLAQLGIGAVNLALLAPTPMQLAHLLAADLLWLAQVLLAAKAVQAPPA